jgi:hypothetical protein
MPPPPDLRLALMSFPQRWEGATLSLNLLAVPSAIRSPIPLPAPLQPSPITCRHCGRS